MMPLHPLVFVYGTLKQGFPNFTLNKGTRIPGLFVTCARYPCYLVGERCSPWLIDAEGEGEYVAGQLFHVDPAALADMDKLERICEPDGYVRVPVRVASEENPVPITVWAYLKRPNELAAAMIVDGPLREYTPEHANRYRSRSPKVTP